jgi:cytochrome c oxidase subunit III
MFGLIAAEAAIFVIFIVAYLFYAGKSLSGPTAAILHVPILFTVCLLSSSLTIHTAVKLLRRGNERAFGFWLLVTIVLGAIFLVGTAFEWRHLIHDEGLTIQTNLFGTTYYSLVGLHAFHVTIGLLALASVAIFALFGQVKEADAPRVDVLSLYWHFVDVVWVVVFTVVYGIGR